ncbi:MAG: hypothetical protein AAF221_01055 [Pseudomonadota bacterium]
MVRSAALVIVVGLCATSCTYAPFGPQCSNALPDGQAGYPVERGADEEEAALFDYYRCLAKNGVEEAQFRLGIAYEEGLGTEVDLGEARYWYSRAARRKYGIDSGISVVGGTKGQRVPRSSGEISEGHQEAKDRLKQLLQNEQSGEQETRENEK